MRRKTDDKDYELLDYLKTGATRMEVLVRDLLAYTQITRRDPPSEPTDANEELSATVESLSSAITEASASVICDPLPPVRMHSVHHQTVIPEYNRQCH